MSSPIQAPPELVKPTFSVYEYREGIYKIIYFKGNRSGSFFIPDPDKFQHYDQKLESSISRARRMVLELALCNNWSFFGTITLDPKKWDRENLLKFRSSLMQWIRDQRKKCLKNGLDVPINVLLVPELHKDGAWHMHGLFSDISPLLVSFADLHVAGLNVPLKLVEGGYYNWPDMQKKFGFCSFGRVRDPFAVSLYITKYLTKHLEESVVELGGHTYFASRPLNHRVKHGDLYYYNEYLHSFCTQKHDFCDTGLTRPSDGLDWRFGLDILEPGFLEPLDMGYGELDEEVYTVEFESFYKAFDQLCMEGYS